jgi:hypothetical protein
MVDYRGIKWIEQHKRWQSSVKHNGVHYSCGMHLDQKSAVMARDTKIIEKGLPTKLQILKPMKK